MNICVTGGLGYIGRHIVENLCRKGHKVTVIDKNSYGKLLPILVERYPDINIHISDIFDMDLNIFFNEHQIETVIHLASETSVRDAVNPRVNVLDLGVQVWLAAANTVCVKRFINMSSAAANQPSVPEDRESEDISYGLAKHILDYRIAQYMDNSTKTFNLRLHNPYGHTRSLPFSDHKESLWFNMVKCVNNGDMLNLTTNTGDEHGTATRDWINIFDVTEIVVRFATHDTKHYERKPHWEIGSGNALTAYKFTQAFNTIEDVDLQINFVPFPSQDVLAQVCDPSKSFEYLDFRSKVGPRIYSNSYLNGVYWT